MKLSKIEKLLESYRFVDDFSKFKIVQKYEDFSVFDIQNQIGMSLSGKVSAEEIEYYGCGEDCFYESTEDGLKQMIAQAEKELAHGCVLEFFDGNGQRVFVTQLVAESPLADEDIKSLCARAKEQQESVCSVKVKCSKCAEELTISI